MEEQEALWASSADGELIRQLFGYAPSLHDALLREIRWIDHDKVRLTLDYRDKPEGFEQPLSVRLALTWAGDVQLNLNLESGDILHFDLRRKSRRIVASFQGESHVQGEVSANELGIELVRVDPPEVDERSVRVVFGTLKAGETNAYQ